MSWELGNVVDSDLSEKYIVKIRDSVSSKVFADYRITPRWQDEELAYHDAMPTPILPSQNFLDMKNEENAYTEESLQVIK